MPRYSVGMPDEIAVCVRHGSRAEAEKIGREVDAMAVSGVGMTMQMVRSVH